MQKFLDLFKVDCNYIVRNPMLLSVFLGPFILSTLVKLIFPLLSPLIVSGTGNVPDNYYSLVEITLITVIPVTIGMIYSHIHFNEKGLYLLQAQGINTADKRSILFMRMISSSLLSFALVFMTILLTDPVPSEGWLRTIFAIFLLSDQSSLAFLFKGAFSGKKIAGLRLSSLYWIFPVVVPLGLLLHHPWNYFVFYSPFYWLVWAWIVGSPAESLIYGSISLFLTTGAIIIFLRNLLRKNTW